jgi:hypothetical protein
MPITPLLHITATFSNAVLVAILPHVSNFAKHLDLPIAQPITIEQVARFNTSPYKDNLGGGLLLTNYYWFVFSSGYVDSFHSPDDWFLNQSLEDVERFAGENNMTTNDAINFARSSFVKLGYQPEDFHVNEQPTSLEGPIDSKKIGHVPYCRVIWKSPDATTREERMKSYMVRFDIDMQRKQIVGMFLSGTNFWRSNLDVGVKPEWESDYQKLIQSHTNVPVLNINSGKPPIILLKAQ